MLLESGFSRKKRQSLRIAVYHLSWILLIVSSGLSFEFSFQLLLDLCQTLQSIPDHPKPCIRARVHTEVSLSAPMEYLVHCGSRHPVLPDQVADAQIVAMIVMI